MLANVRHRIDAEGLLAPGETVVVGVSGGVDSTALLHILWKLNQHYLYGWNLHAVHLNHRFRGAEAEEDAAYVKRLCDSLGVTCHLYERDVPGYMRKTGMGAQEAAREVRYRLFADVARQVGATKVAIAHHADDQVETILFRMLRGTGLRGMAGMRIRRWLVPGQVELVRPLLGVFRRELEVYCEEAGMSPRTDSSNLSRKYRRNRLRLDVLPLLETINPRYREHLLRLADLAKDDDDCLTEIARRNLEQVIIARKPNTLVGINISRFQTGDLALQRRMITLILSYLSSDMEWSSQHVEAVLSVIVHENPSAVLHLPAQITVQRVYERLFFAKNGTASVAEPYCRELEVPGTMRIDEHGIVFRAKWLEAPPDLDALTAYAAVFDAACLPERLMVRNRRPGDRLRAFGSGGKKLKELLIDAKVPKVWRDKIPLLVAGDEIIWVPGVRRSAFAPVSATTTKCLYVEAEFGEEWQEVYHA